MYMGNFLHRVGQRAFERKWTVIVIWLVVIVAVGIAAKVFMQPTSGSITIPGTEAQKTLTRFNELFPDAGAASSRLVVATPKGKTIDDYKTQITSLATDVAKVSEVTTAVSPFDNPTAVSKDKTIAYVSVQLKPANSEVSEETIDKVSGIVEKARTGGLTVEYGGDLIKKTPGEIVGVGEIGGVVLALVVLVATLGALVAAGLPIVIALVTVVVSMAGLFSLSHVVDINSTTPALAVMLGLAVGIDYSLFIINRYRTFVHEGFQLAEAAGKAIATAGNAVIFAATTVVIALSALTVVQIPFMATMGLSAAATVALAAVVAVTLVPALLGVAGMRVFSRRSRANIQRRLAKKTITTEKVVNSTIWHRWAGLLQRYRYLMLFGALAAIVVMALPIRQLDLGLPTDEVAAKESTQRKAYDLLAKGFGAGFNAPLLIVVEGLPATTQADKNAAAASLMAEYQKRAAEQVAAEQQKFQQAIAAATTPEQKAAVQQQIEAAQAQSVSQQQAGIQQVVAQIDKYAPYNQLKLVADKIAAAPGVAQATPILTADNGTKGAIQVIPSSGPSDTKTKDLVAYLRDDTNRKELLNNTSASFGVTGTTALQIDINAKLSQALPVYLAVVVGLSLLLLMIAFRSILIPIKATLGFLLSVVAMFGALVAVFQWGWFGIAEAPGPLTSFVPIITIGILFGLAMDYEFFLVSGMQEAYHQNKNATEAVVRGFSLGSKVVTAAAFIMIAVFAGFVSNHDSTIQTIGFALAFGIFVDAFIVRLTIVPIVMLLLGRAAWWLPSWLDRSLPHVSIEGEESPAPAKR